MTHNKHITLVAVILGIVTVIMAMPSIACAEHEPIGPIDVFPDQPQWFEFANFIPTNPDYKILEFHGTAVLDGSGTISPPELLSVEFDYIDPITGDQVLIPAGDFTVLPDQPSEVWTDHVLPFCPEIVSIHFNVFDALGASQPVRVEGEFWHTCVPLPEPSTFLLAGLGLPALVTSRRRRRR